MQARKHLSNDGAAATAQEARLDAKKLTVRCNPEGEYPLWPAA